MSEAALFFGLSSARLRARCRRGGAALALGLFLPYEIVDETPQFVWSLLPELPPAGVLAALSPTAAGLAILAASFLARRASSLAVTVLAALTLAGLFIQFGADAAAWEVLDLPESLSGRSPPALLALSLTAAGASLMFRPAARRAGRWVLSAALVAAALFYAFPMRGEAPLVLLARALVSLPELPSLRFQLGMLFIALVALWPLLLPIAGLQFLNRPPTREQPLLAAFALYGLPTILLLFAYRGLLGGALGAGLGAALLAIAMLTALLCLMASAVEVLAEAWVTPEAELALAPGLPLQRAAMIGALATVLLGSAQWQLARPPVKGVTWTLKERTAEGDELFGERLHTWSEARLRWDRRVRADSAAGRLVQVKSAARELTNAARALDAGLGEAMVALTSEAGQLDLAGRRWYRLFGEVNEASRQAGLPYYVDPTVRVYQTEEGLRRHFHAHSYRIEKARRFTMGRQELAALHVRQLGHRRDGHARLGFSRDLQPFALVVLDELEPHRDEVVAMAAEEVCLLDGEKEGSAVPRKGDGPGSGSGDSASDAGAAGDVGMAGAGAADASAVDAGAADAAAADAGMADAGATSEAETSGAPEAPEDEAMPLPGGDDGERRRGLAVCGAMLAEAVRNAGGEEPLLVALTEATERHELQHQVDGPHLPVATLVRRRLGGYGEASRERANRELSAYLAEMTGPGSAPRLGLVHLARFALLGRRGVEHQVGLIALEVLSGREVRGMDGAGKLDVGKVAQALEQLRQEGDDALRERARQAWASLFGEALLEVQGVP
ncbi:hypothetical protein [Chondromyces crocatus]|uniref:Uncharacterized protein n=1 Tax=Chondromyces crocatus TaxID=52 RepID=A0A0K1E8G0_CHOCO|nr:hypothetical protein [Chondromyces crocatus]AKT37161.1 uncharacterized protein CMC5_012910 [Chondromyces crocatus]